MKNMCKNMLIIVIMAIVISIVSSSCEEESSEPQIVEEISVAPERLNLKVGQTYQLKATVVPDKARVMWSSSNSSIAAVESNGKVFAGGIKGSTTITAQAGDKKATCIVTVSEEDEVQYPICHEVRVNIGIRTITTFSSEKDPAPEHESVVQISGTTVGTAVMGRIEKIVSDPDYWGGLAQHGTVPVFTGSSDYKLRDENDYSNIIFQFRGPLEVNVKRTEKDYVSVKEGSNYVEKYLKVYDFLSAGKNEMQSISLKIVPYFPTNAIQPIFPHYVVDLGILTYIEHIGKKIVGNGHSLKWDYFTEQLEPTSHELYMGITGKISETDPEVGVQPLLIGRDAINNYFMNAAGGSLTLNLTGSSENEDSGSKTQSTIKVNLEFRSIPIMLALPSINPPPPTLEDWEW